MTHKSSKGVYAGSPIVFSSHKSCGRIVNGCSTIAFNASWDSVWPSGCLYGPTGGQTYRIHKSVKGVYAGSHGSAQGARRQNCEAIGHQSRLPWMGCRVPGGKTVKPQATKNLVAEAFEETPAVLQVDFYASNIFQVFPLHHVR